MQTKNISGKAISQAITSEDILGKDVIDNEGNFIGVAEKVFIDQKILDFIGISIDRGLISRGLTIGKDYIDEIAEDAIFLNMRVVYDIRGMFVFDKEGKKLGTVSSLDIYGTKNEIERIYVKPIFSLFSKNTLIVISAKNIKDIGDNIILNVKTSELSKD